MRVFLPRGRCDILHATKSFDITASSRDRFHDLVVSEKVQDKEANGS